MRPIRTLDEDCLRCGSRPGERCRKIRRAPRNGVGGTCDNHAVPSETAWVKSGNLEWLVRDGRLSVP